jgi:hypothetical protein
MDARQLEYFLAVVDHDGFGRAAAKLHIAQPSLSQAIAALERDLGVKLFHRLGRGVVLNCRVSFCGEARTTVPSGEYRHGSPPSATWVPLPVAVKNAGMPEPPARILSARVP